MPEHTVIDEWREKRDLLVAVKDRVEHQFRALSIEVMPGKDPDADLKRRLEDLQFELSLVEEASKEAEERYDGYSRN
jgi:hypothetical protein